MSVQEDLAKTARAMVEPLHREIDRLSLIVMEKRERRDDFSLEVGAINSTRDEIVRIQKPFVEAIAMMPPTPVVITDPSKLDISPT